MKATRSLLGLAWREGRNTRRRLLLYMSAISLGVAALVAIDSYAENIQASVEEQSRALLGGDISFSARQPFPALLDSVLDSIAVNGRPVARVTTFASMAFSPASMRTRLVQVRAVSDSYPLYGSVVTEPAAAWENFRRGDRALVDKVLLATLQLGIGDSIRVGVKTFEVAGTLRTVPGDPGIVASIGPRVLIRMQHLDQTQLLLFGGVAQREAFVRLPAELTAQRELSRLRQRVDTQMVRGRTAADAEENIAEAVEELTRFLALVGLVALLLGGVGVASGVHAHVASKVDTVAVLRSLGATSAQVLAIYVSQAAVMGLVGAIAGACIGVAIQFTLPFISGDFLPVDVNVSVQWRPILIGVATGAWVALVFALFPLLNLRHISPLQALRRTLGDGQTGARRFDAARIILGVALAASLAGVSVLRSGDVERGLFLSAGIVVAVLVLMGAAFALTALARRIPRADWPYVLRQGMANLWRPGNQTRAVVLALGFGAFLTSTLYIVQHNLLRGFETVQNDTPGNLLLFDIQEEQLPRVDSLLQLSNARVLESTPIITMRISAINGRTVRELIEDRSARGRRGPLQREYRSTYQAQLDSSDTIVEGAAFGNTALPAGYQEVSFEQEIAEALGVALGDTVVWDVQGARVSTVVTSLRAVEWRRMETNFFAVFGPNSIDRAPKQYAILAFVAPEKLPELQAQVVDANANVSAIDLTLVQETVDGIRSKASLAIRFTAVFSLALGIPVLMSAIAATRRGRMRDAILLRILGASRAQIARIVLSEYVALGLLAATIGVAMGTVAAWGMVHFAFEEPYSPALHTGAAIMLLLSAVTALIGYASSRDVFAATPSEALRES